MYLAEAIPPVGPLFVPALQALFLLAAVLVAIGMIKLADAIVRAFFGTVEGTIGWIPFAGRVVTHSLHKIEQKVTHALGHAERKLDEAAALGWHNLARLVSFTAHEIAGAAESAWRLAQQAENFVRRREVTHEVRTAVKPVNARAHAAQVTARHARAETKALHHSVAQGVYPRLKAGEVYDRTVSKPAVATARAEARAAEAQAIALFRWLSKHRLGVAASVFTGAVAWSLSRLGGNWIRCKNWRTIGKHVCRWPYSLIEALLGLGLAFAVVIDPRKTAEAAVAVEDVMESLIRKIAD